MAVYDTGVYDTDTYLNTTVTKSVAARYGLTSWETKSVVARHAVTLGVVQSVVARHTVISGVRQSVVARYSMGTVERNVVARYGVNASVSKSVLPLYRVLDSTASPVLSGTTPASDWAITLQAEKSGNRASITRAYYAEVTLRESAPHTWTLRVLDEDGSFNPEKSTSATWYQRMDDQPYDSGSNYVKKFLLEATYAGQEFSFTGIPTGYRYTATAGNRPLAFEWSGTCQSHKLFREAQTLATVRSTADEVITVTGALGTILAAYGIAYDFHLLAERAVPVQHRQDAKPIDWITELLEVGWDEWRMDGDVFTAYYPRPKALAQADWTCDLGSDLVEEMSVESSLTPAISKVTCTRVIEAGGKLTDPIDLYTFGTYTASWGRPAYGIKHKMLISGGVASDFKFKDASGTILGVAFPRNASAYPAPLLGAGDGATQVEFTWGEGDDGALSGNLGRLEFSGSFGQREDSLFGSTFDSTFTHTATSTAYSNDANAFPKELPDNPLIPTPEWLVTHTERYLEKFGRRRRTRSIKLPQLHLGIKPGDTVREKYARLGVDRAVYVTEVTHRFSDNPAERYTTYTALEYV